MTSECNYFTKKEKKSKSYLDEIENERIRECQKALEREKIANGMKCTKEDEIQLKKLQKMQMDERKCIEREQEEIENMWHQVLVNDCHRKEYLEAKEAKRKMQETLERRKFYDEQINSANKKRQELIRQEREKENRKLEKMKKKMEQDHYEAIKKKKDQQMKNRKNYIEGHESRLLRIRNEKLEAKAIDDRTIKVALEDIRKEKERNRIQMKNLQLEKQLCLEYYNRERKMQTALEEEADRITDIWCQQKQAKADESMRQMEQENKIRKEKAAEEYKRHIQTRNLELERAKQERKENMKRVKDAAFCEVQRKIDSANQELKIQLNYRQALNYQIKENEKNLASELIDIENKDTAFTKKAQMFKDVMASRFSSSPGRSSTNPVHPFKRVMDSKKSTITFHLPSIG